MAGREGLIYSAAFGLMDEMGIRNQAKRKDLLWCLRVMEIEAMEVWAERRKAAQRG